jgi:site-specific recombinase XerD
MIEVLYATGVRFGELADMKKSDINWSERSILIQRGKFKKGRIVLFTPKCATHLKAYLDSRTDQLPYIFVNELATKPIRNQDTYEQFRNYTKRLEYRVTPHMLRYTFAAHLAKRNATGSHPGAVGS